MGVFEKLFGNVQTPAPTAQPNQQQQPGTQAQTPGQKPIDPNSSVQLDGQTQTQKQTSPLDGYKDIWKNQTNDDPGTQPGNDGKPATTPSQQNQQPQIPAYITAAKSLNFSRNLNPELVTKALGGDVTSFNQIIDTIGRSAAAASFQYAEKHFSSGSSKLRDEITAGLPDKFREFSLQNIPVKNEVLKNPAVKPLVDGLRLQLAQSYPDASPEELQQKAEDYFMAISTELQGKQKTDQTQQQQNNRQPGSGSFESPEGWEKWAGNL